MEEKYKKSIEEFNAYVKNYDMSNNMIIRKYNHTFRVADYAKELAESENCNENDVYIAFLCGLLHDIARFKQATEYKTFNDLNSFDHGDMACTILNENDYISKYIDDEEAQNLILKAVKNHNKFSIEDGLNEREMFFAKIARDADKVDIFDIIKDEIRDNSSIVDEKVLEAVKNHTLFVNDRLRRNDVSEILKGVCMIYDLNFKRSYEIINEKGFMKTILENLSKHVDEETMKIITENVNMYF